jgi:predicted anti-sigma-YlaC factor YlaD
MSCDAIQTQLMALLDGELTPEAAAAIEAHLTACATCSAAHDEIVVVLDMTKAWDVPGSDLQTDVQAAVQQQIRQDELHSVLLEMKRLRGEVASLRAEVTELKIQLGQRNAAADQGNSDFLRFPYVTAHNAPRLIL